jgi:hypothetical protein
VWKYRSCEEAIVVMLVLECWLLIPAAIAEDVVVVGTSLEVADRGNGLEEVEGKVGKELGEATGREAVREEGAEGSRAGWDTVCAAADIVADEVGMAAVAKADAVEGRVDSLGTEAEEAGPVSL